MGLSYNPSVVLDGLLFMLDPGNVKSYPGSGTLAYNLINSNSVNLNSVTYSSSFGGCFSFAGSNINGGDLINLRNNIDNLSSLTVSMWVKRNRFATAETIFALVKNTGTHTVNISFDRFVGAGGRSSGDSSFLSVTSNFVVDRNKFYHITLTMNLVNKQTKIYVDGVLIPVTGTTNYASTFFGPGGGSISNRIGDEIAAGSYPFYGLISQVLVYGRELNPSEIYQNYNNTKGRFISTVDLPQNGLVVNNDAAVATSYPGTGNTWYSGVGVTNSSALTNVVYNSSGYMSYDGTAYSQANIGHLGIYLQGPYSINVWAYWNGAGTDIIDIGSENNLHQFGYYPFNGGLLTLWKFGGTVLAATSMETNKWFNASYTIDNNFLKLYYNGELRFSGTIAGLSGLCDTLLTGTFSPNYDGKWQGRISNFQVYNRVLSSSEIQQSYQQIRGRYFDLPDIVRDGLQVAYDAGYVNSYPGSGTNWFDMAGNGVTGVLTNGPIFVNSPDSPSIQFDATNDQVLFGTSSLVKPTRISLGCIFKINVAPNIQVIIGKQGTGSGSASYAFVIQSGGLNFRIESGGIFDATYPFTNLNVYIYAMGTYDGSNLRLYINGVLVATTPFTGSIVYSDSYQLLMGLYASSFATNMNIGAMQLYNRALSSQEVVKNFNAYRGRYGF